MALSWRTTCAIPYLRDYAAASKREAETKPIRGDKDNTKPLGRRDQKFRRIKRMEDGSIAIFDCYRDETNPSIQFFENGDIHILASRFWNKATQNEIITEVTGARVFTEHRKAWIHYDGGVAPLRTEGAPVYSPSLNRWVEPTEKPTPSIFRRNERGGLDYINPPSIITHVINRKGSKAVRMRYMGALSYIEALDKLRGGDKPTWTEVARAFPERLSGEDVESWPAKSKIPCVGNRYFGREHAIEIATLMASEEPGDHYRAYLWLQRGSPDAICNTDTVLAWVHRDEWFTEREPIVGQKAHDRYAWAFEG